ncbi:hypothetical protein Y032_0406g891 [Ancylostoma ceylanicum]|uniref:Uncharacterized protein n=4 Tax=Ancylostoma ceylanicum TaxID=53326 RepID=A0A016X2K2_9BILA|nr:hypothetical protein Y032_0406g891 [Ancylostoma ceylanicum]
MCDQEKFPSLPQGSDAVQFSACNDDPVLPDDVEREQASRSSLENCEVPSENSYLPGSEPASLIGPENQYYEKLIGIDADPAAYPEDLIMIGSSVDVRDDSKPLLLSEEPTISDSCNDDSSSLTSKGPSSQSEKTIMVMPEDIEAAGLSMQNLNDLTEAQFNTLVAIAERRQRISESSMAPRNQYDEQIASNCSSTDSLTMIITDDGSLKLTDAAGQTIVFDRTQLAALRIDVNNLTDESIQQIVQLAMPAISVGTKSMDMSKNDLQRPSRSDHTSLDNHSGSAGFKCNDGNVAHASQHVDERLPAQEPPRNASVRYVKNGRWKVQYEDGRFEWIGEDNANLCDTKPVQHSDHSGYHAGNTPDQAHSTVLTNSPRIKRSCSSDSSFDGIPVLKRRGPIPPPNFCCPVCDRKVYQKEPSYIVIRLPACDDCTKGKMILLDERTKRLCIPTRRK